MKKIVYYIIVGSCLALLGCATTGTIPRRPADPDETRAWGKSQGVMLLSLFEIVKPTYSQAMANLYSDINSKGKWRETGYALENIVKEDSKIDLLLISFTQKIVTADIVPLKT